MPNEIAGITGDILLDAGTNELEVLVFSLAGGWFGVNVAKVREVIRPVSLVASPHRHASVMGMFNIRGSVLPVVDLGGHLGMQPTKISADESASEGRVIITEFNGFRCGFRVETVEQIYRMSWERVKPAPDTSLNGKGGTIPTGVVPSITGVIEMENRLIQMVDFESVADSILHEKRLHIKEVENTQGVDRASKRIVLVEDSPFMRKLVRDTFVRSGYARVEVFSDGQSAWDSLSNETAEATPIDAIVSDIEMPRMDGLRLCKQIKEHSALKSVPVVLFSSLVSEDNLKKGRQVGADMQMAKPELAEMVRIVDRVVSGQTAVADAVAA